MIFQRFIVFCVLFCLLGCGAVAYQPDPDQPNTVFEIGDEAPLFQDVEWLGKAEKLKSLKTQKDKEFNLDDLKGKVVLLNFWSYDCGFCGQVIRWINAWYIKYHDQGLEVVGIHTPEFAYERKRSNVEKKVKKFGIKYPIGMDNDRKTWKAYHNKYRPAVYLIDREGNLQMLRYGTAYKKEIRMKIEELLGEE